MPSPLSDLCQRSIFPFDWGIRRSPDVRHARDPNELLEVPGDELRPIVGDDPGPCFRVQFLSPLQDDLDVRLRHELALASPPKTLSPRPRGRARESCPNLKPVYRPYLPLANSFVSVSRVAKEWPADVIVVGSHGRHGIPRVLPGSVAEAVMRQAECPVLVIRAKTRHQDPAETTKL
jgi:hypothetical protein